MLTHIQDCMLVFQDGRPKDIHDLRENLLRDALAHEVREVLIDHEEHEPTDALKLNQWVLIACFILVHYNISHDFD